MGSRTLVFIAMGIAGTAAVFAYSSTARARPSVEGSARVAVAQPAVTRPVASDSNFGIFEGRTPCHRIATDFTGFPSPNCEKIKWELALYVDPRSRTPTTYTYRGTRTTRRGRWTREAGTGSRAGWAIYHLNNERGARVLSFLAADNNVLLLLDRDLNILVGDASFSYVLNRTDRN